MPSPGRITHPNPLAGGRGQLVSIAAEVPQTAVEQPVAQGRS